MKEKKWNVQELTPEEEKAYLPNLYLELTQKSEIKRLNKVIEEKNDCIKQFKEYDAKRTEEFHRLEQNVAIMEEQYNEWREQVVDEYGKSQVKKFEKMREKVREKNERASFAINGLNDVSQHLPKLIELLREMQAFAESRNPYQETFYKTKVGSCMKMVDKLTTRVVGYLNMFNVSNEDDE